METDKLEIYSGQDKAYDRALKRLKKSKISLRNKNLICDFLNHLLTTSCKQLRVSKLAIQLRNMCTWLMDSLKIKNDLDLLTKKELTQLISFIESVKHCKGNHLKYVKNVNKKPFSEATKADYRRALKQFYSWLKKDDERIYSNNQQVRRETENFYQYVLSDVSTRYENEEADPKTIITEEDIDNIIENGAENIKEKAMLVCLHETGCRAAEFLNLRVGDVEIRQDYGKLDVPNGKTGKRTIYIRKSLPYIVQYIDSHPFKKDGNNFLWLVNSNRNYRKPMRHAATQKMINDCFEKAGIDKKHNMHWFRHSRATLLAPKLTQTMLCKYMGWTINSDQIRTYVHLCNEQLESVFLSMHGIIKEGDKSEKPIRCICGALNDQTARYCYKCYKPLSIDVTIIDNAEEIKELKIKNEEITKTMKLFMEIAKNPELMAKFDEFRKAKG
ncbi:MAG: site-specific integrase [Candidatus Omnitrophica bacterium]|nr:site-specific integrase [Candidatus Omnitrophota bacterium]